jgi:hypothetical protein
VLASRPRVSLPRPTRSSPRYRASRARCLVLLGIKHAAYVAPKVPSAAGDPAGLIVASRAGPPLGPRQLGRVPRSVAQVLAARSVRGHMDLLDRRPSHRRTDHGDPIAFVATTGDEDARREH